MKARRLRRSLILAGLVALAGLGVALWPSSPSGDDWVRVQREDLVLSVDLSGTLVSDQSILLGPPGVPNIWDYKISSLAEEGSQVKAGEIVLAFDTTELERRLRDKSAEHEEAVEQLAKTEISQEIARRGTAMQLREAEARLGKARLKVDVPAELVKRQELEGSRVDLRLAEREVEHLRGRVLSEERAHAAMLEFLRGRSERARQRVEEIGEAIARMSVPAPEAGTVIHVSGRGGEKKKVGDQCWRGEKVVEIPDLALLSGIGMVDEADAGKLGVGQPLKLRLESHPDEEILGRVRKIHSTVRQRSPSDPAKVVRLDLELELDPERRLRPGMRFSGSIEIERAAAVLVAPPEAIFATPQGPVGWRRQRHGVERVPVELGRRNERYVEILGGLVEDDQLARRDRSDS